MKNKVVFSSQSIEAYLWFLNVHSTKKNKNNCFILPCVIFWTFWCMTHYTRYISQTVNQVVVLVIYLLRNQDCNIVFAYIYHHYMLTQYSLNICYFWALRWNLSRFTLKFVSAITIYFACVHYSYHGKR